MPRPKKSTRFKAQVRIIAGEYRGRKLPVLEAPGLRPTTDRIRETLFNWLMHDTSNSSCLDLFAGSGALGFESLSRGASFVQYVEKDMQAAASLKSNLKTLGVAIGPRADVYSGTAERFLKQSVKRRFDLAFLDPPFDDNMTEQIASDLEDNGWLSDHALIYVEYRAKTDAPALPSNWCAIKQGRAGQSNYSLWQRQPMSAIA